MTRTNREVYLFFALSFFSHYDLIRLAPGTCLVKPFAKPSSPRQNNASISDTIWGGGHHLGRRPHGPITMLMKPGHQPSARLPPPVLLFGAWHSRLTSGEMRYAAWRGNMYLLPSLSWLEREAVNLKVRSSSLLGSVMSRIALITLPSGLIIHAHQCSVGMRAHPDLNQGPADLQSAALTTELCTQMLTCVAAVKCNRHQQLNCHREAGAMILLAPLGDTTSIRYSLAG